jgi:glycosyltransferase involved in cell wall biosynthesis
MDRGGEETAPGMEGGSLIPPPPPKRVKREKLAVARTALPKGHSLKVVGQESQPGRLETRPIPELFGSSSVLAKVRNFLPQLKGANEDLNRRLQAEDPKQFDVEYISDDEKPHVEMNIALVSDDDSEDEAEDATGTPSVLLSRTLSSAKKKPGMIEVLCDSADEATVSVIIPVHNGMPYLEECLQSIVEQTYPHSLIEVSIFDDASTDGSLDAIRRWKGTLEGHGFRYVYGTITEGQANRGAGYARNRAVAQSQHGKLLCFMDCDDTMMPTRVAEQVKRYGTSTSLLLGSGFLRSPADATERYTQWCNGMTDEKLFLHQYREVTVIQPTWFMAREWFKRVGGYKEQALDATEPFPDDLDFFHRHLDLHGSLGKVQHPLVNYRFLKSGLTWKTSRKNLLRVKVQAFERRELQTEPWSLGFTIWGNGRDGKDFLKALSPAGRVLVSKFADVDPAKIKRGYHNPSLGVTLPVIHFSQAVPPVVICVAMDRGGELEANVASMGWTEGVDYWHFS